MYKFLCGQMFSFLLDLESLGCMVCNEMKTAQTRTSKGYLFETCSKGVSHHHLCLAETQRQVEKWEGFIVKEREGFQCAMMGGYWCAEVMGG